MMIDVSYNNKIKFSHPESLIIINDGSAVIRRYIECGSDGKEIYKKSRELKAILTMTVKKNSVISNNLYYYNFVSTHIYNKFKEMFYIGLLQTRIYPEEGTDLIMLEKAFMSLGEFIKRNEKINRIYMNSIKDVDIEYLISLIDKNIPRKKKFFICNI